MVSKHDDKDAHAGAEPADDDASFADEDLVAAAPRTPRIALGVALAAAVLSVLALAGLAYQALGPADVPGPGAADTALEDLTAQASANSGAVRQLEETASALRQQIAGLEQSMARMESSGEVAGRDIDALERRVDGRLEALETVPARVAAMERSLSTLRGISTGARDAWLLAQAEYFLQIANAELELARNPQIAATALEMADQRLVSVGDPGLTDVRRALSSELQALNRLDTVDIAGTTVTLASLSRVVDTLPLHPRLLSVDGAETGDDDNNAGLSGTARAMATLRSAFSSIVSIRRTDEEARPLIAPEAVYFLRTNLSLQLQAARLALLRGERMLFEQSLDDAASWLRDYYDVDSTPVASALTTINEIRDAAVIPDLPDISRSLRLLRQHIAFEDAGRSATPEDPEVPPAATEPDTAPDDGQPR